MTDPFGVTESLVTLRRERPARPASTMLAVADWTVKDRVAAALAGVGLQVVPHTRLAELSGGQRTRASVAAVTFTKPDFLLLDEPKNNLDCARRKAVHEFLAGWCGGAIVVSRDCKVLEHVDAVVELEPLPGTQGDRAGSGRARSGACGNEGRGGQT